MKYENIQTFLATLDHGSIAKAAEDLYISQGTASTRIRQLEEELGTTLLYRQKGIHKISLTQTGEEFLPIAQQWLALWQDALHLKELPLYQELKISATDTINLFLFASFYYEFSSRHTQIALTIKTHHSSEIHRQIDSQICDIGFCTNQYNCTNILFTPLLEERMVLVVHRDHPYNHSLDTADLSVEKEIYLPASTKFVLWHNQYFHSSHPLLTVGTVAMQQHFLRHPEVWTIMPSSAARDFISRSPDHAIHILPDAPKRTVFLLSYKFPRPGIKKATDLLIHELLEYIKQNDSVSLIP